VSVGDVEQFFQ